MLKPTYARLFSQTGRLRFALVISLGLAVAALAIVIIPSTRGANPASGAVSEANPQINWTGAIMPADPDLLNSPRCNGTDACDDFALTINPPSPA